MAQPHHNNAPHNPQGAASEAESCHIPPPPAITERALNAAVDAIREARPTLSKSAVETLLFMAQVSEQRLRESLPPLVNTMMPQPLHLEPLALHFEPGAAQAAAAKSPEKQAPTGLADDQRNGLIIDLTALEPPAPALPPNQVEQPPPPPVQGIPEDANRFAALGEAEPPQEVEQVAGEHGQGQEAANQGQQGGQAAEADVMMGEAEMAAAVEADVVMGEAEMAAAGGQEQQQRNPAAGEEAQPAAANQPPRAVAELGGFEEGQGEARAVVIANRSQPGCDGPDQQVSQSAARDRPEYRKGTGPSHSACVASPQDSASRECANKIHNSAMEHLEIPSCGLRCRRTWVMPGPHRFDPALLHLVSSSQGLCRQPKITIGGVTPWSSAEGVSVQVRKICISPG